MSTISFKRRSSQPDYLKSMKSSRSLANVLRGNTIPIPINRGTSETLERVSSLKASSLSKSKSALFRQQSSLGKSKSALFRQQSSLSKSKSALFRQSTTSLRYRDTTLLDLENWVLRERKFNDDADVSQHPSYNIKTFSYDLNCYVRYLEAKEKYDSQFHEEMQHLIDSQSRAIDMVFLRRTLCYNSLWPPLHTKRELTRFVRKFFQLTPKQKNRLNYLMKTDLSLGS